MAKPAAVDATVNGFNRSAPASSFPLELYIRKNELGGGSYGKVKTKSSS